MREFSCIGVSLHPQRESTFHTGLHFLVWFNWSFWQLSFVGRAAIKLGIFGNPSSTLVIGNTVIY